jgi:hypothetical protein
MDIPTTAASLLVIILSVLPGVPGDHVYRALAGVSWREKDTAHLLRLLVMSVLGLVVYAMAAAQFGWPPPRHVVPATYVSASFSAGEIGMLGVAYAGHFVGSAAVAVIAVVANRVLGAIRTVSATRDAWDHFVRCSVPSHWVVVTLQNGDSVAGILDHADVSTEPANRDLVIAEPYLFESATQSYRPTYNQYMFVRGSDVASIAVVHAPDTDTRVVPVDESPFMERSRER